MRSRSKPSETSPSLFDESDDDDASDIDAWDEVPQARFLTWSDALQLNYCWRRDLDAALRAENDTDATFYLRRAAAYKAELDELLT